MSSRVKIRVWFLSSFPAELRMGFDRLPESVLLELLGDIILGALIKF